MFTFNRVPYQVEDTVVTFPITTCNVQQIFVTAEPKYLGTNFGRKRWEYNRHYKAVFSEIEEGLGEENMVKKPKVLSMNVETDYKVRPEII